MQLIKHSALVFFLVFQVFVSWSQSYAEKYAFYITQEGLYNHLKIIASDSLNGRETGSEGQFKAAYYISKNFKELGILPGNLNNQSYYQYFNLIFLNPSGEININENTYQYAKDYLVFEPTTIVSSTEKYELIYINSGVKQRFLDELDLKNKFIVLTDQEIPAYDNEALEAKYDFYNSIGAAGVLFATSTFFELRSTYQEDLFKPLKLFDNQIFNQLNYPLIFTSTEVLNKLDFPEKEFKRFQKEKKIKEPINLGSIDIKINHESKTVPTTNVLGFIQGTDSLLREEVVVIMAHYDHLGEIEGDIYNGADDNGSGTAALLEIAKALSIAKTQGHGSKRSVLFLAVTAEELGLFGSLYYTENPAIELDQTISVLNVDMIGRSDDRHEDPNYVYIIGSNFLSNDLHEANQLANKEFVHLELDYLYNDINHPTRLYFRSDHYNFAKHGIPSIFYFAGLHEDYHEPTDTIDKIDFDKLEKVTKLIYHTAWKLLNTPNRPALNIE